MINTSRRERIRGTLVIGVTVLVLGVGFLWRGAPAGDLFPPDGMPGPTGRTLDEIYNRLDGLEAQFLDCFGASNREIVLIEGLANGASTIVAGSGPAILHSITVQTGRARIIDANGVDTGLVYAHAVHRQELVKYDSSYQVHFNVELELPFTVTNTGGTNQTAALQIIMTRVP